MNEVAISNSSTTSGVIETPRRNRNKKDHVRFSTDLQNANDIRLLYTVYNLKKSPFSVRPRAVCNFCIPPYRTFWRFELDLAVNRITVGLSDRIRGLPSLHDVFPPPPGKPRDIKIWRMMNGVLSWVAWGSGQVLWDGSPTQTRMLPSLSWGSSHCSPGSGLGYRPAGQMLCQRQ